MYLSHLMINVGDNPDRPRPGRLWLRNIYHVHQRLSMAFPSPRQRAEDPRFLSPFDPAGFQRPRLLFRIDNAIQIDNAIEDDCPRAVILVQSDLRPDWVYAFQNARMFLAAEPETRDYSPTFLVGAELRFRIRVNLSKKSTTSKGGDDLRKPRDGTDAKGRPKSQSKRVSLTWDKAQGPDAAIEEWFASKATPCGFTLRDVHVLHLRWVVGYRPQAIETKMPLEESEDGDARRKMRFRSALLEGTLTVTEAAAFAQALASGIGSAKAFGFGLLSVAPE